MGGINLECSNLSKCTGGIDTSIDTLRLNLGWFEPWFDAITPLDAGVSIPPMGVSIPIAFEVQGG